MPRATCPVLWVLAFFAGLAWNVAPAVELPVADPAAFAEAAARAKPGDQLILADGTWPDASLVIEAEGTAEAPITVRAATPGRVVFTGASRLRIGGRHLVVAGLVFRDPAPQDDVISFRRDSKRLAEDCRLTGCVIEQTGTGPERESKWVSLYGRRHRVDHCRFEGKSSRGTTFVVWLDGQPNDHRIDHNYFGPRPALKKNGGETIRIGDSDTSLSSSRTTVEANWFEACDGEAEIISNKSCDNVYRGNVFERCSGALTLRHGHRALVEGNWFLGQGARGTGGVRVIGEAHRVVNNYFAGLEGDDARAALSLMQGIPNTPLNGYSQVVGAVVVANTFVDCRHPVVVGLSDDDERRATLPPVDCLLAGNLFVGGPQNPLELRTEPAGWRAAENLVVGTDPSAAELPDGFRAAKAELAPDADGVKRLAGDTGALRVELAAEVRPTLDIHGQPRPERITAGCHEPLVGAPPWPMLRRVEVGPAWEHATAR